MVDPSMSHHLYVGVDIAADTLAVAGLPAGGVPSVPFTGDRRPRRAFATLQRHPQATGVPPGATLAVLEATGNYWVALAVTPHEAGYRVAVVNPQQAHHFAKAQLRRAKTDAPDAPDLARLAAELQPTPWTPPPAVCHEARQRPMARDGLLAMRTAGPQPAPRAPPMAGGGGRRVAAPRRAHRRSRTGASPAWRPSSRPCSAPASGRSRWRA